MKRKRHRLLRFTYKDIAKARGVTIYAVWWAVRTSKLDPDDLSSIARYVLQIPEPVSVKKESLVKQKQALSLAKPTKHRAGGKLHNISELLIGNF